MNAGKLWDQMFLEDRPSIGLSFFRIFVALTVGFHVIPSFFHMDDNYLSSAFKTFNPNFFTDNVLGLVQKSPDAMVIAAVVFFLVAWFCFLVGLRAQVSCIALTLSCYYFYALNDFHIGTLSWDILLVTMFLMCVTPYHGDYFSLDALYRKDPDAYRKMRPFFLQRLLQIQIAFTFFYTALYKITAQGNWLSGNPLYALMNYPAVGVTKNFLLKEWLAGHPQMCYGLGVFIVMMELAMPLLLFYPKTRRSAIILGVIFHMTLILTLDVPAIFLFLFPAQLLLFINPKAIIDWVEEVRSRSFKVKVLYDGNCSFCKSSVDRLKVMDLWGHLTYEPGLADLDELKLVEGQRISGGFDAFRRLCHLLPMCYPLVLVAYLPGVSWMGRWSYRRIAQNRHCLLKQP